MGGKLSAVIDLCVNCNCLCAFWITIVFPTMFCTCNNVFQTNFMTFFIFCIQFSCYLNWYESFQFVPKVDARQDVSTERVDTLATARIYIVASFSVQNLNVWLNETLALWLYYHCFLFPLRYVCVSSFLPLSDMVWVVTFVLFIK
jgi:hypothetical protein